MSHFHYCPNEVQFPEAGDLTPSSLWAQAARILLECEGQETRNSLPEGMPEDLDSMDVSILPVLDISEVQHLLGEEEEDVASLTSPQDTVPLPSVQPRPVSLFASSSESQHGSDGGLMAHYLLADLSQAAILGHTSGPALIPGPHESAAEESELLSADVGHMLHEEGERHSA